MAFYSHIRNIVRTKDPMCFSRGSFRKDVYESICAFSNRNGGHIFLGIKDNGEILGIESHCIEKMKKDFVTAINNANKMYPPLFLTPVEYELQGKRILYIYVPFGTQVCRCSGRIYDRNNESDIDITDNEELVYKLYARKQGTYFVNRVFPEWGIDVLCPGLIERARKITRAKSNNHAWLSMDDEELLRSAGLILLDRESRREGITLAAILLFGKDTTIMSALPQHKTDMIFRVQNLDRYDDRDVIVTNLLDSYDRMSEFAKKHLNDPFVLYGMQSVSARDAILREIISNSLAHRDYSSGYVAKMVIEKDRIFAENRNRTHGYGNLNLNTFEPFPKNPAISKVFREIGLADELGSGMRNTYKFTKLYSGGIPQFVEGDIFKTIIPLNDTATMRLGPISSDQVSDQVVQNDVVDKILEYCKVARTKKEIAEHIGYKNLTYMTRKFLKPLLERNKLLYIIPKKPQSKLQKYITKQ